MRQIDRTNTNSVGAELDEVELDFFAVLYDSIDPGSLT